MIGIEHLTRLIGRQERVDVLLGGNVHALEGVGEHEAVHADHDGQRELLCDAEGLDVQVDGLLIGLRKELDPAAVALAHGVRMVVPDVDRCADRTVGDRHDDRESETGRVVDRLDHEEQALGGGGRIGAGAGNRCADGNGHGRELALDVDVLAILEDALAAERAKGLDDVGLRRDRVRADDFGAAERHGLGNALAAFQLLKHEHLRAST